MRTARVLFVSLVALALAGPASAASTAQGAAILAIQLSRGVADLASAAGTTGEITSFNHSELGVQAQYWYFMREDYAVNLSAGIGYFKQTDTADPSVLGADNFSLTINSWQIRLGGDRFAKLNERLHFFAGPGIQVWSGRRTYEDSFGEVEEPSTLRLALTGRIGAHILMGENFGLIGHVGQYWGYATAEDGGAKTKSLPSGSEGAMGFSFGF